MKEAKESEPIREEESPLLYTGKDFKKDLEVAIAANDLNKAKFIFDTCKSEYTKASNEKKQELFKTLNELYSRIKDHLKVKKKQSLEGEISSLEEEGILHPTEEKVKEEKVFVELFSGKPAAYKPEKLINPLVDVDTKQKQNSPDGNGWEVVKKLVDTIQGKTEPIKIDANININPSSNFANFRFMKNFAEDLQKKLDSMKIETPPIKIIQPPYNPPLNGSKWTNESIKEEQVHFERSSQHQTATAERLMEEKIKEKINESAGVIKLALEKKDLHRAIIEYNKLKEIYTLIPPILVEEKSSIYQKIVGIYKEIKRVEQEKLMTRLSGPVEHRLTEEELVDKIASRIDRTQAFILNKDLQKAVEEYQEVNDLFDLLPETLPEIKKRFLVELARLYQGLQHLNEYLQKKGSQTLFDHDPNKVLPKYAPNNPVERVKRSISKIERYLQAKAIKSAMLEFNKIKSLCDHLPPLEDQEKKSLFEELKSAYIKIDKTRREYHEETEPLEMEVVDIKEPNKAHLEQVKSIHADIKEFYSEVNNHKIIEARNRLLDIQHKIAQLPDEKEQHQLLNFLDQLCHKTHFTEQEKRLAESSANGRA